MNLLILLMQKRKELYVNQYDLEVNQGTIYQCTKEANHITLVCFVTDTMCQQDWWTSSVRMFACLRSIGPWSNRNAKMNVNVNIIAVMSKMQNNTL